MCLKLNGKKIQLRPISRKDTDNILRWRNQDWVRQNFIYQDDFTVESHEMWLQNMVATGKVIQFIIVEKQHKMDIGSVYLRDIKEERAEFGIFIGEKDFTARGLGREATMLIISYGFKVLKLKNIFLRVLVNNKIAIKSYKSVGFSESRYLDGEVKDKGKSENVVFMTISDERISSEEMNR